MQKKVAFFKEAVKSIKTSGTFIPSSRFLVKRMLKNVNFQTSEVIIEFGPGNGIITTEILKRLKPKAILICFEINQNFHDELERINNDQLVVLNASAEDIESELLKLGISKVDSIISSLPLAILPKELSQNIIINAHKVLKNEGIFVQYQYSIQFLKQFKTIFNKNKVDLDFEPLNVPPAFLYVCEK
ncbi:class I SAM-dependent methyltransferase [Urechidicola croceus]|uniref:Ribosomal RNA adenine dimethylase n=1 Tax=Urechidicola croceus TaxID=1850246 RepID=A0A1D8PC21_9FLAO|nr:rRNA adenine N-6-methyltransferase family protein [Urechidicola croceus]AOW22108.1 ribosomal RNA adenine dimethylase [Urechidicola croceus]